MLPQAPRARAARATSRSVTRRLDTGAADPIGETANRWQACADRPASDGRAPRPRSSSRMSRRRRIDFLSLRFIHPRAPKDSRNLSVSGLGLGQQREPHARGAGRPLVEVVDAERADAVELAAAAGLADAPRALELDHRRVAPREAVEGHLQAEARAGAVAVGVLARQPPVDHEVIVELGVVGDVGEVLEDLLARTGDDDLDADGIHGAGVYPRPVRRPVAEPCARARSGGRPPSARAGRRAGAGRGRR